MLIERVAVFTLGKKEYEKILKVSKDYIGMCRSEGSDVAITEEIEGDNWSFKTYNMKPRDIVEMASWLLSKGLISEDDYGVILTRGITQLHMKKINLTI